MYDCKKSDLPEFDNAFYAMNNLEPQYLTVVKYYCNDDTSKTQPFGIHICGREKYWVHATNVINPCVGPTTAATTTLAAETTTSTVLPSVPVVTTTTTIQGEG